MEAPGKLQGLHPHAPSPGGAAAEDVEAAWRLHRALNARPARRGCTRPRPREEDEEAGGEEEEEEEVKIRLLELVKDEPEEEEEDVTVRTLEGVGEGGKRRRVKREREEGAAEAGPSGRGADGQGPWNAGRGVSGFRGVTKLQGKKAKPWAAQIKVKQRNLHIGTFAQEEEAARAYDRVSIARLGHAEAKTNFPAAEYRAEWAELEALGVEGAVALMRKRAAAEQPDVLPNKTSRFRGVTKLQGKKAKPWAAHTSVRENGKRRSIHIGTFAREEDAARARDRVSIAKLGHAEAKTNFPAAEYRAEWAELEALGVEGAAALMKEHAAAERQDTMNMASRFKGVNKANRGKGAKPWAAEIRVTEDSKSRSIYIGTFAREEDAARAHDRVSIANLGHAKAKTNFPVVDYRAEWAQLKALGVEGAVALERERAAAERVDVMSKASRFRGVCKANGGKGAKPWAAEMKVTEDGKHRKIYIGTFAREEDAARAYDRVSIAKLGHAEAKTNFPVTKYRAEWAELEALGVDAAASRERQRLRGQL